MKHFSNITIFIFFIFLSFFHIILGELDSPKDARILEDNLKAHVLYNANGSNNVGHILIDDRENGINQSTWLYVKSALDYYKNSKPVFIILELNTPGGEIFAAQKISDDLKELDSQYNIPVVCFINNWAISAGAMLAYSCRYIAVVKDASMGAAEPVLQGESGQMTSASEKINSAIRTDFANRANYYDRNPNIAEAMVDKDIILVMRDHKIIKLDNDSQIHTTGDNPDILISPKGKLLTLTAEQLINYGVADIYLPPKKLPVITPEEKHVGKWPANQTLLFQAPFFDQIPNATIDSYRMDWKTNFFVILANPVVSSILFLCLIVGFYIEFNTPGFGLGGTVAVTSLFLIILSSFALEIGNWLELILLITGIAVILVELFILPTFGLLGFIGILFFLAGLFGLMIPEAKSVSFDFDTHSWNAAGDGFFQHLSWLCGTLLVGFTIIALLSRYIKPTYYGLNKFVLSGNEQKGYIAGVIPSLLPKLDAQGEVLATLRPAGKVIIDNVIYDAVSSGGFIEKGATIKVQKLDGSVIVVTNIDSQNT